MNSLLEKELQRVEAPTELWERVEMPREAPVERPRPVLRWAAVAATVSFAVLGWNWISPRQIRTSDAGEIRTWVQSETGLDVPFSGQPPSVTRLSGARLAGVGMAEIAFTAGSVPAVLRLARSGTSPESHARVVAGSRVVSWTSGGQRYTMETSTSQAMETACRLCHG